jgi:hypothetical protein
MAGIIMLFRFAYGLPSSSNPLEKRLGGYRPEVVDQA